MYGMRNIENNHRRTMSKNLGGDNGIIKPYWGPSKPHVCLLHEHGRLSQGSVGNSEKQQGRAGDNKYPRHTTIKPHHITASRERGNMGTGEERELWKAITFLCGYSSLCAVLRFLHYVLWFSPDELRNAVIWCGFIVVCRGYLAMFCAFVMM